MLLQRLDLLSESRRSRTGEVYEPLVTLDLLEHGNKTVGIGDSSRPKLAFDLVEAFRNAETLELEGHVHVKTKSLLVDEIVEKRDEFRHFPACGVIEGSFAAASRQFYGESLKAEVGNFSVRFV